MAGNELKLKSKINASTIMEVLVSMVIIMVIFGIAMMICANVMQSSLSLKKIKARAILNDRMADIELNHDTLSKTLQVDDLRIEQVTHQYGNHIGLMQIDLNVFDPNQQLISEVHKIILRAE
jgi:Tfp pilus assembly protein PilV